MNDYDKDQDYSRRTSDEAKKYQLEADGGEGGHGEPIANYELHHQTKNESDAASSEFELEQEAGVSRIEALYTVFGYGWKLWALYIALGLFCYANSLEGNTTYNYQQFAVSSFGAHPLLSTIGILTSIMGGVIKPFVSKIADLFSRPSALAGSVILLAIGMMVTAVSKDVHTVAAGSVLSTMGGTGVDVVFTILLGDLSPLKWRGFMQGLSSMPYVVNFAISPKIVAALKVNTGNDNWRWGYGMFAIIIPACAAPILFVLYWADHRAKKAGTVSVAASDLRFKQQIQGKNATETVWSWMVFYWRRIDGFGLILLGFAFSLILLPFSLAAGADHGYKNRSLIAMFVVGGLTMIAFFTWEWRYARFPLMPKRVMNRTMICCCVIDFLYYFSAYIPNYFTSWIFVVKDWSFVNYNYWSQCLGVALCFFGLCAGIVMRYTKRYKWTLMFGLCARAIGMGLQFLAANGNKSDAVLVISQIFVGIGGGCSVVGTQVAVQAAVPHRDMGTAIALLALWTSVGGAIGNAIAGALWTHELPKRLAMYAGDVLNSTQLAEIAGSTPVAHVAEPRAAIIRAYDEASWLPMLLGLIFTIAAIPVGFWCKEFELGDAQNAVEEDKVIRVKKQAEVDAELEGRA